MLMADQTLVGWGNNYVGMLGTGNANSITRATPLTLPSGVKVKSLAQQCDRGYSRVMGFISTNNELYLAGDSGFKQMLSTHSGSNYGFTKIMDNVFYASISDRSVIVQLNDLTIKGWGHNSYYALNTGNTTGYYADQAISIDLGTDNGQSGGTVSTASNSFTFSTSIESTGKNLTVSGNLTIGDGTNNTTLISAGSGGSLSLTLPDSAGSSGQYLQTNGSGTLTWSAVTLGSIDKITEGNTDVETVDTGTDGHIKFSTEGSERMRIIADGKVGIGITAPTKELDIIGDIQINYPSGIDKIPFYFSIWKIKFNWY